MLVKIFTAYPEFFASPLNTSLLKSSQNKGIWKLEIVNLRDYGIGKHKKIDDTTFGGGSGLVMRADILSNAIEKNVSDKNSIFLTSPRGKKLTQNAAQEFAKLQEMNFICNRFEGVDQRVIDYYKMKEISIGDYVLLGGEVGVCVILETVLRLIPNFLQNHETIHEESFSPSFDGMLEYPHYTQPAVWNDIPIPEVLKTGNHNKIEQWRKAKLIKL